MAVLVLDADSFGTQPGLASDSVLVEIAALLREIGGADGAAFRVGADGFALILPGCGITAAESAFARLQATLRNRLDTPSRLDLGRDHERPRPVTAPSTWSCEPTRLFGSQSGSRAAAPSPRLLSGTPAIAG